MRLVRAFAAMVLAVGAIGVTAAPATADEPACTTTFTGAVSTAWELPANWDSGVPSSASVACWAPDRTVVISTGNQAAHAVRGGGLTIAGGSLDLGNPVEDPLTYEYNPSRIGTWTQTAGTLTGHLWVSLWVTTATVTGTSVISPGSMSVYISTLSIEGDGAVTLADGSVGVGDGSISDPHVRLSGDVRLGVFRSLTMGSGVLVHHVGAGHSDVDTHVTEFGGSLVGPSSGDYGFPDSTFFGRTEVAPDATFHAAAIGFGCTGSHGGSVGCDEITGTGTIDTREVLAGPGTPQRFSGGGLNPGAGYGGTIGTLHLVGPVTIDAGARLFIDATSPSDHDRVQVTGGPVTMRGIELVQPSSAFVYRGGDTFDVLTDAGGIVRDGDQSLPAGRFRASSTASVLTLTETTPTVTALVATPRTMTPSGSVTLGVTVSAGDVRPTGEVVVYRCQSSAAPSLGQSQQLVDGHATFVVSKADTCDFGDPDHPEASFTVAYLGDDTGAYGHARSVADTVVHVDYGSAHGDSPAPSASASPERAATPSVQHSCVAPPAPHASKTTVGRGRPFRLTGQVVLVCNDTPPRHADPPTKTRVDLTHRGKNAFGPGIHIGNLAVDPDQHVHGWVMIPTSVRPGRYAIHVHGAGHVLAIIVR